MSTVSDTPRQMLCRIVRERGIADALDRKLCASILKDRCAKDPAAGRGINLILHALDLEIPQQLLTPVNVPLPILVKRMIERLEDQLAVSNAAARWAVETWDMAVRSVGLTESLAEVKAPRRGLGDALRDSLMGVTHLHDRFMLRVPVLRRLVPPKGLGPMLPGRAEEITVGPGGRIADLYDALATAPEGARLILLGGVWKRTLVIDRPIEIVAAVGRERPVIEVADESTIVMRASEAVVRGVEIRGQRFQSKNDKPAVEIEDGKLELSDCVIVTNLGPGIRARGSGAEPLIERCVIKEGATEGIVFSDNARGRVLDSTVQGPRRVGILVFNGGDPVVRLCRIEGSHGVGIQIADDGRGVFELCDVRQSGVVNLAASRRAAPVVRKSTFRDCTGTNVLLDNRSVALLEQCVVDRSSNTGIQVRNSSSATLRRCRIARAAKLGVSVEDQSGARLEDCTFDDIPGEPLSMSPAARANTKIVGGNLNVPDQLAAFDPRTNAPPGMFRGVFILTLLSAGLGALAGLYTRYESVTLDRAALWTAGLFAVPAVLLLVVRRSFGADTRRVLGLMLTIGAVIGAIVGTILGVTHTGPATGAAMAAAITFAFWGALEAQAALYRLRGGKRSTVAAAPAAKITIQSTPPPASVAPAQQPVQPLAAPQAPPTPTSPFPTESEFGAIGGEPVVMLLPPEDEPAAPESSRKTETGRCPDTAPPLPRPAATAPPQTETPAPQPAEFDDNSPPLQVLPQADFKIERRKERPRPKQEE
jgi:hypothetical protein